MILMPVFQMMFRIATNIGNTRRVKRTKKSSQNYNKLYNQLLPKLLLVYTHWPTKEKQCAHIQDYTLAVICYM